MSRFFLEVAYDGQKHSGFQIQNNAPTIQGEINQSLEVILKGKIVTHGSSRTDAGVHAYQNFLHVDLETDEILKRVYNINAILPPSIVLRNVYKMTSDAHARFSATARSYKYVIYAQKNPFLKDFGYFYPFPINLEEMNVVAKSIVGRRDFSSFSKRNTQVNNFYCDIQEAEWSKAMDCIVFEIKANRFLRGMVRGLVATMLKVGRGKISLADFEVILSRKSCGSADFTAPGRGLFLEKVHYPEGFFT